MTPRNTWLRDRRGEVRWPWWLAFVLGVIALVVAIGVAIGKPIAETVCNQRAAQMEVVDGDYRLLMTTCFLTLSDGTVIPSDQYRAAEPVTR
jgi:hypothetical protein